MFHRRDILKAALTVAAFPALKLPAFAKAPRRFIDIHCHFFNAADLPIGGFLKRVVMSDYNAGQTQTLAGSTLSVWKGLAATLIDRILKYDAPTSREELDCLGAQTSACARFGASASQTRGASRGVRSGLAAPAGGNTIADVLVEHYQAAGQQPQSGTRGLQMADGGDDTDAFADFVLKEMESSGGGVPGASSRGLRSLGPSLRSTAGAIDSYLASGRSVFSRYFTWGELLTNSRQAIIETYYSLYDPQHTRLILTAPAIVDYNYWLKVQEEKKQPSPLKDQVELLSVLSLRQPRPMHGFVAFDPLREIREPSALAIVQEAVTKHGFLGVKLYSPMGFKPTDNAAQDVTFPAYASQSEPGFGAALDRALDALYAWCEANEVPILAHTLNSQAAGPGYGERAEPKFWEKVLTAYPKLRLNLAHFGNFMQAFAQADASKAFDKTWEYEIGTYIKSGRFPNVYGDISYFWWVLDGSGGKDRIATVKKLFARYFEADPHCEHLMFGTDWNMMGRAQGAAQYVDNVEAFFRDMGLNEQQLDNLFYKNALRYLGLDHAGMAEARLKSFYAAAGKPFPAFG